ncbi:hypothetical protein [Pararhodobacter sp. SW119]|uniref:hypothetical protein n=1 Tax=Pararhodobacter sp. SW119 TaxID=2780075 RepID=UPI001ADF588A|nr:hypothetical protein [Pararhodobacter sp. SW119]
MPFGPLIRRLQRRAARALGCVGLVGAVFLSAGPALTKADLPGAEHPALTVAVENWLDNDEETALPAISRLAHDGNKAAQLLLAIIDKTPALQGPWLAHLPRAQRITLMRQPGGVSGRSWLHALSDHPLGSAWLALMNPATGPEVIERFEAMGEARAAREAMVALAARENPGLRDRDPAQVPPDTIYLLWRGSTGERSAELLDRIAADSLQRALVEGTFDPLQLSGWLAEAPLAAPLDAICSRDCHETRATCLSGAYLALASHNALLTLGSPVEAIIEQDDFLSRPRGRSTVLRRILQTHDARGRRAVIAQMRTHDACLADMLAEEAARYHYNRVGNGTGPSQGN